MQRFPSFDTLKPPVKPPVVDEGRQPGKSNRPGLTFPVSKIEIFGHTLIGTLELDELVQEYQGRSLCLSDLEELAEKITGIYRAQGYPLARAVIPPQAIASGVVLIRVVEARYGQIILNNTTELDDAFLEPVLKGLRPDDFVAEKELDRSLLLLSDIGGTQTRATFKPGSQPGTTDLILDMSPLERSLAGNITLDNQGNRSLGQQRLSAGISLVSPFDSRDVLSANLTSQAHDMTYGSVTYDALLAADGLQPGSAIRTSSTTRAMPSQT